MLKVLKIVFSFRDRLRTSVNVLGDSFGAGVIAHLCRFDLAGTDKLLDHEAEFSIRDSGIEMKTVEKTVKEYDNKSCEYSSIP